jgi:ABC-type hemin transport system ATPase subunit
MDVGFPQTEDALLSITAKVFVDDLGLPVTSADLILGIVGSHGGKNSTLMKRKADYESIKNKLTTD